MSWPSENEYAMTLSIFGLLPQAASVLQLPVYVNTGSVMTPITNHEGHQVQKEILAELLHAHQMSSGKDVGFAGFTDLSKVTLIDFRHDLPGLIGKPVLKVVCVPLYFCEVNPRDWVIPSSDMVTRLRVARETGLLMIEPNKAIAVVVGHEHTEDSQHVSVFMTDEHGVPRRVPGLFPYDRRIRGSQPSIASLNRYETECALREAACDRLIEASLLKPSRVRLELLSETESRLNAHLVNAPPERKPSGAIVYRSFAAGGINQVAENTRHADGWVRYPTGQDSWYFGVWVNFKTQQVITYAEGDITHVVCLDSEPFQAELQEMAEFYGLHRLPCAKAFGEDGITHFYDTLLRMKEEHRVVGLFPADSGDLPVFVAVRSTADELLSLELDQERVLSPELFELDLLHISAFNPDNSLRVVRKETGLSLMLQVGDMRYTGQLV